MQQQSSLHGTAVCSHAIVLAIEIRLVKEEEKSAHAFPDAQI